LTNDHEFFQTMIIYENNQDVIAQIKNFQFHLKTKHIDIQTHFVREKMSENAIQFEYVFTNQMIIDDLIKSIFKNKFVTFRATLKIR
jgi:kynurenine formamidase